MMMMMAMAFGSKSNSQLCKCLLKSVF
jgi:hypothetical protein